jgi:hypothetical protein
VVEAKGLPYEIKEKEGNFYAPKIDVDIKDSLGREWQCGTVQLDLQMPKRFRLAYTGTDGKEHTRGRDPQDGLRLAGAVHRDTDRALPGEVPDSGWRRSRSGSCSHLGRDQAATPRPCSRSGSRARG